MDAERSRAFGGATAEGEQGSAAGLAGDFEFQPADASTDAGTEGLGAGLFGGEAGGEALGGVLLLAAAVGDLARGKDALQEALAEAVDALRDARNLHQVRADADDQCSVSTTNFIL